MYLVSQRFLDALHDDHTVVARVDVIRGSGEPTSLDVISGSVTTALDDTTRRSLDCEIIDSEDRFTLGELRELLDPFTCLLVPYRGIRFPDGTEEVVPLGVFYPGANGLELHETDGGVTFQVSGYDASTRCQGGTARPYLVPGGQLIHEAIPPLLLERLATLDFKLTPSEWTAPPLVIPEQADAWDWARKLAISIGQDLYMDRLGVCVSATAGGALDGRSPVWEFEEGPNSDFWGPSRSIGADAFPNVVVVVGTNSGAPGIRGEAADLDPTSPTYRYGPYGEKVRYVKTELATDNDQAAAMANTLLARTLGPADEVPITAVPNPALDEGDVVAVTRERLGLDSEARIAAKIVLPLVATDGMTVTCRRTIDSLGP